MAAGKVLVVQAARAADRVEEEGHQVIRGLVETGRAQPGTVLAEAAVMLRLAERRAKSNNYRRFAERLPLSLASLLDAVGGEGVFYDATNSEDAHLLPVRRIGVSGIVPDLIILVVNLLQRLD